MATKITSDGFKDIQDKYLVQRNAGDKCVSNDCGWCVNLDPFYDYCYDLDFCLTSGLGCPPRHPVPKCPNDITDKWEGDNEWQMCIGDANNNCYGASHVAPDKNQYTCSQGERP